MVKIHKKVAHVAKRTVHKIKKIFKGFTIVELIIVIAIIGVLASIVTVAVTSQVVKAKDSKVKAEIYEIAKGANSHYFDYSSYSGYSVPPNFTSVCAGSMYTLARSSGTFVIYAKLCSNDSYWCADSTGAVKQIDNPPDNLVYSCISGSGTPSEGCGDGPTCSVGNVCYDDFECIECNNSGLCGGGEDCRCTDCACTSGTCMGSGDYFYCVGGTFSCGQTLVDSRDGEYYATVQIGTQCWMAENLNVGTRINGVVSQTNNGIIEKHCYNDNETNCATYGGMYQWDETMQYSTVSGIQGICPTGWHIPAHDEFTTLERSVCTSGTCATDFPYDTTTSGYRGTNEATKLLSGGSSGLNLLLAGYSGPYSGGFGNLGDGVWVWSSSQSTSIVSWIRQISSGFLTVYRAPVDKPYGISVRCVKN